MDREKKARSKTRDIKVKKTIVTGKEPRNKTMRYKETLGNVVSCKNVSRKEWLSVSSATEGEKWSLDLVTDLEVTDHLQKSSYPKVMGSEARLGRVNGDNSKKHRG